jgi:hypothetical protein
VGLFQSRLRFAGFDRAVEISRVLSELKYFREP